MGTSIRDLRPREGIAPCQPYRIADMNHGHEGLSRGCCETAANGFGGCWPSTTGPVEVPPARRWCRFGSEGLEPAAELGGAELVWLDHAVCDPSPRGFDVGAIVALGAVADLPVAGSADGVAVDGFDIEDSPPVRVVEPRVGGRGDQQVEGQSVGGRSQELRPARPGRRRLTLSPQAAATTVLQTDRCQLCSADIRGVPVCALVGEDAVADAAVPGHGRWSPHAAATTSPCC